MNEQMIEKQYTKLQMIEKQYTYSLSSLLKEMILRHDLDFSVKPFNYIIENSKTNN